MPTFVDLSTTIANSPAGTPDFLATRIEYVDHATGAGDISRMFGVGPELLRDHEGWAVETFTQFGTHSSTHIDAPRHYNSTIGGQPAQSIDQLPLEWFFGRGVCLDFTGRADGDVIEIPDLQAALAACAHTLAPLDIVLIRTGRDAHLNAPDYMSRGVGVSAGATLWLYDHGVRVMGVDAWGWDAPLHLQADRARVSGQPGVFWAAHQVDRAYSQIERLVNLHLLPATGFTVACFPLKIAGGSAGPARVVAIVGESYGVRPHPAESGMTSDLRE